MKRAEFLRTTSAVSVAATLPLTACGNGDVVEYTLTAAPLSFSPAPGIRVSALAYNGMIPGPLLRVRRGQRVRVRYRSTVDIPTSVHWHGMALPNRMDGVAYITQAPVLSGDEFLYEFAPQPTGTRWYHDHGFSMGMMHGLFGMFVVDDPNDEPTDREYALVFHDVPRWDSVDDALRGVSSAPMVAPRGVAETMAMPMMPTMNTMAAPPHSDAMGDEVAYRAHCVNGACYPRNRSLPVKVGDRVRLRILNASPTQTRYIRLAEHRMTVTHGDGNRLPKPVEVDVLRVGVAERYDAYVEIRRPGAFLVQGLTGDTLANQQATLLYTEGMENAPPARSPQTLEGLDVFSYEKAAGLAAVHRGTRSARRYRLTLDGGGWGNRRWTINEATWPMTPKLHVRRGERIAIQLVNKTEMDHPMHLHGHIFDLVENDGNILAYPLRKDVSLISASGGTAMWEFNADADTGRWLLHCHNEIHMADGMMMEVVYDA